MAELVLPRGKHPATVDDRDKRFEDYVDGDVIDLSGPPPTSSAGHGDLMPQPRLMLGNGPPTDAPADQIPGHPNFKGAGDCVFALIVNLLRLAWAISGKGVFPAGAVQALMGYSEVTGYQLGQPSTDNGTNMRTALKWLRNVGLMDQHGVRHKIGAFAKIDLKQWNHVLWALYLMDTGVPTGVMFPDQWMSLFNEDLPWTPLDVPPPEEGHAILLDREFAVETWARDQPTDPQGKALQQFADEMYVVFDPDGLTLDGKSLEGFDAQQLVADVNAGD